MNSRLPIALLLLAWLPAALAQTPQQWPPRWPHYWPRTEMPAAPPAANDGEETPETAPYPNRQTRAEAEKQAERAREAMRAGNYAIAYHLWLPLAEAGDAEAQFGIGWMYHNGYGLVIDNAETVRWWRRAAEQGHADALFALGMLYAEGDEGLEAAPARAAELYLRATRAGQGEARFMLKEMLRRTDPEQDALFSGWDAERWALLGTPLQVGAERANIRLRPSLKAPVVATLNKGHELVELSRAGRWVEVILPRRGRVAWVHDSLVTGPPL